MTLIEVTITAAIVIVLMSSVFSALNTLMENGRVREARRIALMRLNKALSNLWEELQSSDAIGTDTNGFPIVVVGTTETASDTLEFRRIERYVVDGVANTVTPEYSNAIRYWVNADQELIREEAGTEIVVGAPFEGSEFQVLPDGSIEAHLWTPARNDVDLEEIHRRLRLYPRNN